MKHPDFRRRPKKSLTLRGETKSQAEWAKELGLHPGTIAKRLRLGLPIEQVLSAERYSRDDSMKHIFVRKSPYEVRIKTTDGLLIKCFQTLEEAQLFRDNYLSSKAS